MRLTQLSFRAAAVVAAALTAGAAMATPAALAAPAHPDRASVESMIETLGANTVGSYLDSHGNQVVTVTDYAGADKVRAAGLTPRMVQHSRTELQRITTTLGRQASIPGTAWAVDPSTDQVVVTVDGSVSAAQLATVRKVAGGYGDAVRISSVNGTFSTRSAGGDAVYGGGYRCSLGFNVTKGGSAYFLTAGHCGNVARNWYSDAAHKHRVGSTQNSKFPGNDFALVKYAAGVAHPSSVDLYGGRHQAITRAANPQVGERVRRSGSTSHVHSGKVQALDATVNYEEGTVYGLIQTNVCAEAGDSGGPLFDGNTALGLTSGGNGDCSTGGTTFFQPVNEPLRTFGARVG
ncbi:MAG: S1 family peptidase [Actinocatenispora sp.]